jgi:hypothetical protein
MQLKLSLTAILLSLAFLSQAQVQNALDFDNVDDYVTVPNASALINGKTQMSLTFWVYPTNTTIAFPDYDGYCGFRNNTNADFYVIRHGTNNIEARFRNSAGTAFDVVYPGVVLNTWQHFAFVYADNQITLYIDGVNVGSTPASGSITNTVEPLHIGNMPYDIQNFYHKGKLDEVCLWDEALTAAEVNCIYLSGIDPSDPEIILYYNFNQGQAGLNNAGLNTLTATTGSINGTLYNFALFTNNSNWVGGVTTTFLATANICPGQSYVFGSQTLTAPGIYTESFPTPSGCDSTVTLTLTTTAMNLNVTQAGVTLTAAQAGGVYQWLNCNNNFAPIPGATSQSYTATANGSYAVRLTYNGCTDTSLCKVITTVGITENTFKTGVQVFPVPFKDKLTIDLGMAYNPVSLTITDLNGRIIFKEEQQSARKFECSLTDAAPGMYFLEVRSGNNYFRNKVIKE